MHRRHKALQQRAFSILEVAKPGDRPSRIFDLALLALILANLVSITLATVDNLMLSYGQYIDGFEKFSVWIFSIEYLLRVWSCTIDQKYGSPILGRIRYIFQPLSLVDLLSIAPYFLPLFLPLDIRFIRFLRLFRVIRLLKLSRYFQPFTILGKIIESKRRELIIMLVAVLGLLWVASTLMYFLEHDAQPDNFSSIPATMWWGVATLTTVGYGDVYPVTPAGRLLGSVIAILGIGLFALPTGLLASGFAEELDRQRNARPSRPKKCPHCGKLL